MMKRLDGISVAITDQFAVSGEPLQCDSRMLESFVPPYTATVVEKLTSHGGKITNRGTMMETALPLLCSDAILWLSQNSDSNPDVFAFEATAGRISRHGFVTASGLSRVGIMAKNVEICSKILESISGIDEKDAVTLNDVFVPISENISGKKIGLITEFVQKQELQQQFTKLGITVQNISISNGIHAEAVCKILIACETSSATVKFDGAHENRRATDAEIAQSLEKYPELKSMNELDRLYFVSRTIGLSQEDKTTIILGAWALNGEQLEKVFLQSSKVRRLIHDEYQKALQQVDFLVAPLTRQSVYASMLVGLPTIAFSGMLIQAKSLADANLLNLAQKIMSCT